MKKNRDSERSKGRLMGCLYEDIWLEMQGRMAVGFVNLNKAYDTVPKEMGRQK